MNVIGLLPLDDAMIKDRSEGNWKSKIRLVYDESGSLKRLWIKIRNFCYTQRPSNDSRSDQHPNEPAKSVRLALAEHGS